MHVCLILGNVPNFYRGHNTTILSKFSTRFSIGGLGPTIPRRGGIWEIENFSVS